MDVHITTRHGKLTDAEHDAAVKAAGHFERYYDNIIRVDAILDEDGAKRNCEYTVKVQGHTVVARETAFDYTKAIHDAAEKIERQLTRLNEKQHDTRVAAAARI